MSRQVIEVWKLEVLAQSIAKAEKKLGHCRTIDAEAQKSSEICLPEGHLTGRETAARAVDDDSVRQIKLVLALAPRSQVSAVGRRNSGAA